MLDEGAGTLGALELARAVDDLGAQLATGGDHDASFASLTVLKRNLPAGFALLADVVARPRFDAKEWRRVYDLWTNDLKSRGSDPAAVARVLARAALFGPDHPYGHPSDGTLASAAKVTLDDAKRFYAREWRPDRATLVVVGDVTKDELAPLLDAGFGTWRAPNGAAPAPFAPPAPAALAAVNAHPRVVMVDRPDAPQAVIALVRTGVAASDPDRAPLDRVNTAIGGGFTSRLNQDLREEHNWSYGAGSRVSFTRGRGFIVAQAAVQVDKTIDALRALMADLDEFAKKGLTDEEVDKTRSQARADLVTAFETVDGAAGKLATDAAIGLPPDHEAAASARRDAATKAELNALAAKYYDTKDAILCIVGPKKQIDLSALGLPAAEMRDADGNVVR
jgi:predicted Zn-dependent peptidase